MNIAFIGTGVMGAPMARHLAEAGHRVTVYNRSPQKAKALEPLCRAAESIADCVKDAEYCFTIVGFVHDVEEVYFSEKGIFAHIPRGAVLCDMTTSSPELARRIDAEARARGMHALDAPVSGGESGAVNGSLSVMVGGEREIFDRTYPLFSCMGKTINYMGEAGCGQIMKAANQICIAGALCGVAEALYLGKAKGLDPKIMLDVICHGAGASRQAEHNGRLIAEGNYNADFFAKYLLKDLRLGALEKAELSLPVSETCLNLFEELVEDGKGDLGIQAIYEAYRKRNEP